MVRQHIIIGAHSRGTSFISCQGSEKERRRRGWALNIPHLWPVFSFTSLSHEIRKIPPENVFDCECVKDQLKEIKLGVEFNYYIL
jgi:hypothetical protein